MKIEKIKSPDREFASRIERGDPLLIVELWGKEIAAVVIASAARKVVAKMISEIWGAATEEDLDEARD